MIFEDPAGVRILYDVAHNLTAATTRARHDPSLLLTTCTAITSAI